MSVFMLMIAQGLVTTLVAIIIHSIYNKIKYQRINKAWDEMLKEVKHEFKDPSSSTKH